MEDFPEVDEVVDTLLSLSNYHEHDSSYQDPSEHDSSYQEYDAHYQEYDAHYQEYDAHYQEISQEEQGDENIEDLEPTPFPCQKSCCLPRILNQTVFSCQFCRENFNNTLDLKEHLDIVCDEVPMSFVYERIKSQRHGKFPKISSTTRMSVY
jgi:hypothetical protein